MSTVTTTPVVEPLTATMDPTADPAAAVVVPGSNGLVKMDPELAWTVDFQRAVTAGMAVSIPLSAAEACAAWLRTVLR